MHSDVAIATHSSQITLGEDLFKMKMKKVNLLGRDYRRCQKQIESGGNEFWRELPVDLFHCAPLLFCIPPVKGTLRTTE